MFDGLLKSKFYTKCKSAIKLTRTRIEMIMRKRIAMQKYLKNDIADLLKNGLDSNAFGRVEGLFVEMNLSSCYEFVDQCCASISSHLSIMNKQMECPEECRESVPCLMFAAARFSDLPELRELRSVFAERYGNTLDQYINNEFVNKTKSMPPTKELKLRLMQDIALEFGIEWNSKALEQSLYNPPPSVKSIIDDTCRMPKTKKESDDRKSDSKGIEFTQNGVKDYKVQENIQEDLLSRGRKVATDNVHKVENRMEIAVPKGHKGSNKSFETPKSTAANGMQSDRNRQQNNQESSKSSSKNEVSDKMQVNHKVIPPPPYQIKPKVSTTRTNSADPIAKPNIEFVESKPIPKVSTTRTNSVDHLTKPNVEHVEAKPVPKVSTTPSVEIGEDKPTPRSVRRTRVKPPPCHENVEYAKQALRILNMDHRDKKHGDERMINKLLLHYSAKQSSTESVKVESSQDGFRVGKSIVYRSKGVLQSRQTSLPTEPTSPIESAKGYIRSSSLEPEILNQFGHVHPNLPNYDDFVARLAELRGSKK